MSSASSKAFDSVPVLGLLAFTRAALGCGIGMMVANKFKQSSTRQTTAIALLSVGVLGSVPFLVRSVWQTINRPESERAMRKRLASIRGDVGFMDRDEDMF